MLARIQALCVFAVLIAPVGAGAGARLGDARSAYISAETRISPENGLTQRIDAPAGFLGFAPGALQLVVGTSASATIQASDVFVGADQQIIEIRSSGNGLAQSAEEIGYASADSGLEITVVVDAPTEYWLTGTITATNDPGISELGFAFAEVSFFNQYGVGFGEAGSEPVQEVGTLPAGEWVLAARAFANGSGSANEASFALVLTFNSTDPCSSGEAIVGTDEANVLEGTTGDDVICGLGGADLINGHGGSDLIFGGDGNDVIVGGEAGEVVVAGRFLGGNGNDFLLVSHGTNTLDGGTGRDRIAGGDGNDTIDGGGGDDFLAGGRGDDAIAGGDGNDFVCGAAALDLNTQTPRCTDLHAAPGDADVITGDAGNDSLRGAAGHDTIAGGDGDDFITGDAGEDQLAGGVGVDRMRGGLGRDALSGGESKDYLRGGPGADELFGDGGADRILARDETADAAIDGGEGNDRARIDVDTDTPVGVEVLLP